MRELFRLIWSDPAYFRAALRGLIVGIAGTAQATATGLLTLDPGATILQRRWVLVIQLVAVVATATAVAIPAGQTNRTREEATDLVRDVLTDERQVARGGIPAQPPDPPRELRG